MGPDVIWLRVLPPGSRFDDQKNENISPKPPKISFTDSMLKDDKAWKLSFKGESGYPYEGEICAACESPDVQRGLLAYVWCHLFFVQFEWHPRLNRLRLFCLIVRFGVGRRRNTAWLLYLLPKFLTFGHGRTSGEPSFYQNYFSPQILGLKLMVAFLPKV